MQVVLPILVMIGLGALLRRLFTLDVNTLVKVGLYALLPAFIFEQIATTTLDPSAMLGVAAAAIGIMLATAAVIFAGAGALRPDRKVVSATLMLCMFQNCGNFGIPLATLAFGDTGQEVQSLVIAVQSLSVFTLGVAVAGSGGGHSGRDLLARIFQLPLIYAVMLGLLARLSLDYSALPTAVTAPIGYLGAAIVPVALLTLGAQLATKPRWPRWKPLSATLVIRLLLGPAMMAGLLWLAHVALPGTPLDLWGPVAAVLIVTAGVPSAVNSLLLTMEMGGDTALVADGVFWTTVLCIIPLPVIIATVRLI